VAAELASFVIFFSTVSRHRSSGAHPRIEGWMMLVIASTIGFLILLLPNVAMATRLALAAETPAFPRGLPLRTRMVPSGAPPATH